MLVVKKLKNFFWNFEKFQETICNNNCRRPTQRAPDPWTNARTIVVRVTAFYEYFSGFEFFLLPNRIHTGPNTSNASRWAAEKD